MAGYADLPAGRRRIGRAVAQKVSVHSPLWERVVGGDFLALDDVWRTQPPPRPPLGKGGAEWLPRKVCRLRAQRGIALMLVLWVVALLTIIAVGMTAAQRTESALAANQRAVADFRGHAEAAINFAALELMMPPPLVEDEAEATEQWVPDGAERPWLFAGEGLMIAIVNEASLIDLNQAPRELIVGLLGAAEVPEADADALADAILDWRDLDDLHLLNGAEDADYEAAGRPYGAKDGPFDSVEELQQVLGFDRALYRTLAPALTVDAGSPQVVQEFAPPLVQAALQGISLEEVQLQQWQRQQQQQRQRQRQAPGAVPGAAPQVVPVDRGGPLYRIRVRRNGADAPVMAMEALVAIHPGQTPPVRIRWRRYGLATEPAVVTDEAAGAPPRR